MKNKYLFAGLLLFIFQTTVLFKAFSINDIYPSLIKIFLIFVALKFDLKDSLKLAFLFGFLEDLYVLEFFMYNIISDLIIVTIVSKIKHHLDFDLVFYGISLVVFISIVDILIRSLLIFFKTGIFYISVDLLMYLVLNTFVYLGLRIILGR